MGHYSAEMGISEDYLKEQKIMHVCDYFRRNSWKPKIGDKVKIISIDHMKIILTNKEIKPYLQLVDVKLEITSIKKDKFFFKGNFNQKNGFLKNYFKKAV
jgi:hypothetical protein